MHISILLKKIFWKILTSGLDALCLAALLKLRVLFGLSERFLHTKLFTKDRFTAFYPYRLIKAMQTKGQTYMPPILAKTIKIGAPQR